MRIDAPEITGSLIVSGSISISGSLNLNGSNVSSGNGGTASAGTISGSTQISALGFVSASVTGSSLISASIAGNTITLNKGNGATLTITLPEGSVPTDISDLNTFSGSAKVSITALNQYTSSLTESIVTHTVTNSGTSYYIIDGVNQPVLSFAPGITYRFNLSGIAGSHPFKFSQSQNGPTEYTTGVTSGSGFIQIETNYNTPTPLYYYCNIHSGMGNSINGLRIEATATTASLNALSASALVSASILSNTITFHKGNQSTLAITLPEGSTPTNISALNTFTASVSTSVGLLQSYTASVSTSVGLLQSTASYLNTTFSASVNSRLNSGGGSTDISALNTYTASVNTFTASVNTSITSLNTYTQSNEQRVSNINTATASLFTSTSLSITGAVFNGGTLTFTKGNGTQFGVVIPDISSSAGTISGSTQISGLGFINATQTSSMNVNSASYALTASHALNAGLSINTGSFAITGSNSFIGNQIVTGSLSLSGSLRGNVLEPAWQGDVFLVSSTWSMDFSKSNFFQLQTVEGNNHISASNWQPGQTVSLKIKRVQTNMTASFAPSFKFPSGSAYTASVYSSEPQGVDDIITFITYDTNKIYASSVKNMI